MIVKTDRQDIEPFNKTGKFSQPPSNNRVLMRIFVFLVPNYKKVFYVVLFQIFRNLYYLGGLVLQLLVLWLWISSVYWGSCPVSQSYIPRPKKWRYRWRYPPPSVFLTSGRRPEWLGWLSFLRKPGIFCAGLAVTLTTGRQVFVPCCPHFKSFWVVECLRLANLLTREKYCRKVELALALTCVYQRNKFLLFNLLFHVCLNVYLGIMIFRKIRLLCFTYLHVCDCYLNLSFCILIAKTCLSFRADY